MTFVPCPNGCGQRRPAIKKGYFKTKWNGQPVPRYLCRDCGRCFSSHTALESFGQHKPQLNDVIFRLYASATTQRRIARVLGINRKTVVRKFLFLARLSRQAHDKALSGYGPLDRAQFDEMESFEHTRLKPLSIALAVEESEGKLLAVEVASMPAKGKLADISRRKYGYRADHRLRARRRVLETLKHAARPKTIATDAHPAYPRLIRELLPSSRHLVVETRMGKRFRPEGSRKNVEDGLFTLNYTAAKIRHDLSRMARRVWVTTKKASRLKDHLDLYIAFNNGYPLAR